MLPISLASKVIGSEIEIGSAVNGARGLVFDVDALVARGVEVTWLVVFGVDDTDDATLGVDDTEVGDGTGMEGTVTFGAVAVVGVGVATLGADDEAPAGTKPTKSAAARATPLPTAPSVVRRFRLKALLLLVIDGCDVVTMYRKRIRTRLLRPNLPEGKHPKPPCRSN
jgi:hypothetical protein